MLGHRSLNVEDYLTILKRRWWIILIPMVIVPIIAVASTYFIQPQYVSATLVLIDQQKIPGEFVKPLVAEALDSRLAYLTEQIESRSTIEPIINKYNLYADQHLSMDARVDMLRKTGLHIEAIQSEIARANGLPGFQIRFTANDPHTAQQVCAEITSLFTGNNLKARQAAAQDTTDFLTTQLADAKRTLDDQDKKVADFQRQYFGMLPGDEGNNMSIISSLNSRLDADTQNIQSLEGQKSVGESVLNQQLAQLANSSNPSSAQAPGALQKQLDTLLAQKADIEGRYGADYPDVRAVNRQIQDVRAQMAKEEAAPPPAPSAAPSPNRVEPLSIATIRANLRAIDAQIQLKRKDQAQLETQIRGYEGLIQSSPEVEAQYKQLTRDQETSLALYNKLKTEVDSATMTTQLEHSQQGETFTVLDPPSLPTEATWPKVPSFAFGGLFGGLALGVLIVAFIEYKDTALRTERDVWELTHLPTLAVIAWSGDVASAKADNASGPRRLFGRKPKEALADA